MGRIPSLGTLGEVSASVAKYSLSYIRPYHLEIARRLVLGQRAAQICEELGMSSSRMSIIINSPLFKIELKKLEEERDKNTADVTRQIAALAPIALEQVERTMYMAESPRLRFDAAESVLDRAGFGRVNKTQVDVKGSVIHSNLTEGELRQLVLDRVNRMKEEAEARARQEVEAEAIAIDFDDGNGEVCSIDEQKVNGGIELPNN